MDIQTIQYVDTTGAALNVTLEEGGSLQLPWPCRTWHREEIQAWLDAGNTIQPPPEEPDPLAVWRKATVVSAFQARAALTQAGYMDDVKAHMADPATDSFTVLAWESATEVRRNSPTVKELAGFLGLSDEQVDDLFRFALTIYA
ncbi:hypothetical protein V6R97_08890 [Chromohalobacter salexigens]|uniref:hypothetical protein n=1 Tax=Chromohalobacter israelensis TaxID=141390 RepID=UPI0032E8A617